MDNDASKKNVYDKLIIKVNIIDNKIPSTSRLVSKTQHDLQKQGLQKNIDDDDKKKKKTD